MDQTTVVTGVARVNARPGRAEQMFPTLTPAQIARVAAHGRTRQVAAGEVLAAVGQATVPFFVITSGLVQIVRPSGETETLVVVHGPGEFTGEANMLSGRRSLVLGRANETSGGDRARPRTSCRSCRPTASSAKSSCARSSCAASS